MSDPDMANLIHEAVEARLQAHAKYSRFSVGSAILSEDGTIFRGCNVENASFGLTLCAERVALTSAITSGHRTFQAIAIVADRLAAPCGACRQVLAEFCDEDFPVHIATAADPTSVETHLLGNLLPERFRLQEDGE